MTGRPPEPRDTAWSVPRALAIGTLAVGALDLADAFLFFGFRGVAPLRILQSIAAGLLGREAFQGGLAMAALGLGLHFVIAFAVAGTYIAASRRLPVLVRHPFVLGPIYGVGVWLVMNFVVIPLSAAVQGPKALTVVVNGLLIHAVGVGLPSALAARRAARGGTGGRGAGV